MAGKGRGPSPPPPHLVGVFRSRLLLLRRRAGRTQQQVASTLGVSRNIVTMWETGAAFPSVGLLVAVADAFGVTTDWLLGRERPPPLPRGVADCRP